VGCTSLVFLWLSLQCTPSNVNPPTGLDSVAGAVAAGGAWGTGPLLAVIGGIRGLCACDLQQAITDLEREIRDFEPSTSSPMSTEERATGEEANLTQLTQWISDLQTTLSDLLKRAADNKIDLPKGYPVFPTVENIESPALDACAEWPDPLVGQLGRKWRIRRAYVNLLRHRAAQASYISQMRAYIAKLQRSLDLASVPKEAFKEIASIPAQSWWPLQQGLRRFYVRNDEGADDAQILGWYSTKQRVTLGGVVQFADFPKGKWYIYTRTAACEKYLLATATWKDEVHAFVVDIPARADRVPEIFCYSLPGWTYLQGVNGACVGSGSAWNFADVGCGRKMWVAEGMGECPACGARPSDNPIWLPLPLPTMQHPPFVPLGRDERAGQSPSADEEILGRPRSEGQPGPVFEAKKGFQ
jgi:hypothetical protein